MLQWILKASESKYVLLLKIETSSKFAINLSRKSRFKSINLCAMFEMRFNTLKAWNIHRVTKGRSNRFCSSTRPRGATRSTLNRIFYAENFGDRGPLFEPGLRDEDVIETLLLQLPRSSTRSEGRNQLKQGLGSAPCFEFIFRKVLPTTRWRCT